MQFTRFGATGMKVSRLCLGCMTYGSTKWREWALEEEAARPFIKEALEKGINFFDTADVYSVGHSEEISGRALKDFAKRSDVVLATKVHGVMGDSPNAKGLSRKHIMEAIDASLKRLGTDYVDLYQIHRFDPETPIEETIEALNDVVRAGKALYVGASSMYAWQFQRMIDLAKAKGQSAFVSMQNYYNLIYREEEREMMPLCEAQGIAVIPWSPMARGYLAGSGVGTRPQDGARENRSVQQSARPGHAAGRGDPHARRRRGQEARGEARGGGAGLGALQALHHRPDHRRLEAAPSGRRRGGGAVEARAPRSSRRSKSPIRRGRSRDIAEAALLLRRSRGRCRAEGVSGA